MQEMQGLKKACNWMKPSRSLRGCVSKTYTQN
jgi:hypothetical protein